jgi:hypothetical protein
MSSPTPSRPSPPVHPTLQQLDELEILMQRMLALPVSPAEGGEEPEEPPMQRSVPLVGSQEVPPATVVLRTPPRSVPESFLPPLNGGTAVEPRHAEPMPSVAVDPGSDPVANPPESPFVTPPLEATVGQWLPPGKRPRSPVSRRRNRIVPWRRPLLWSNRLFDRWALQYGRGPGRWLRGAEGRALLGWTGLLLLVTALAWGILDWIGWTR